MATATKTARTIVASVTDGLSKSGSLDISTALGLLVTARVVNGGTPPSTGCLVTVNVSTDGTNWRKYTSLRAGVTASEVYDFPVSIAGPAMHAQVTFGTTDQSVTKEALGHELTSVG